MTPEEARQFDHYSEANASAVQAALPCGCQPYKDVFTYLRWQAQGFQVRKGEHGVKLPTLIEATMTTTDAKTGEQQVKAVRLRKTTAVFCRHQVDPKQ